MLITLRGHLAGSQFINEDGVCYPLKYKLCEDKEVFINCHFNEDGTLSVFKIKKA